MLTVMATLMLTVLAMLMLTLLVTHLCYRNKYHRLMFKTKTCCVLRENSLLPYSKEHMISKIVGQSVGKTVSKTVGKIVNETGSKSVSRADVPDLVKKKQVRVR